MICSGYKARDYPSVRVYLLCSRFCVRRVQCRYQEHQLFLSKNVGKMSGTSQVKLRGPVTQRSSGSAVVQGSLIQPYRFLRRFHMRRLNDISFTDNTMDPLHQHLQTDEALRRCQTSPMRPVQGRRKPHLRPQTATTPALSSSRTRKVNQRKAREPKQPQETPRQMRRARSKAKNQQYQLKMRPRSLIPGP